MARSAPPATKDKFKDKFNVAVVGASGNIGRKLLTILEEREFPIAKLYLLASASSVGKQLQWRHSKIKVTNLELFDFRQVDLVFGSAGGSVSEQYAKRITDAGALYIDNSSHFRYDAAVPLVVPEVNPKAAQHWQQRNIIANPNCSTIQMVVALKPIHDLYGIESVKVATYQSVSGAGKQAMDELYNLSRDSFMANAGSPKVFSRSIAFNVIPQIDVAMPDRSFREEWKMVKETKKILAPDIKVDAICVRVPVFVAHAMAVFVTCKQPVDTSRIRSKWRSAPGIIVIDDPKQDAFATPKEIAGSDDVFCSRLRKSEIANNQFSFWCTADNLRKGGALNAVQIAELLIENAWCKPKAEQTFIPPNEIPATTLH